MQATTILATARDTIFITRRNLPRSLHDRRVFRFVMGASRFGFVKVAGSSTLDTANQPKKRLTHSCVMAAATDSEELTATSGSSSFVTLPRTEFRGWITRKKTTPFQEVDSDRIKGRGRRTRPDGTSIVVRFGRSHERLRESIS
jgi:hypothetical protein